MVNLSLQSGKFAENWKNALVRPLLKKSGLDQTVFKNFRPISNLQFVSKLTEREVAKQISDYMNTNNLFPSLQSAYRKYHSTETALLKVKNDLLINMNNGHVTLLVLLDLSAAFDTVDHGSTSTEASINDWRAGNCSVVVSILPGRKNSTNLNKWNTFKKISPDVWCSPAIMSRSPIVYDLLQ